MMSIIILCLALLIAILGLSLNDDFFTITGGVLLLIIGLNFLFSANTTFFTNTLYDHAINLSIIIMGLYIFLLKIITKHKIKKHKKIDEDENYDKY